MPDAPGICNPMPTIKPSSQAVCEHDDSPAVSALMSSLSHPLKVTLGALRQTILAADPEITEGIRWNSPSFHCSGWFVTLGCRKPAQVEVVLHCGAAVRSGHSWMIPKACWSGARRTGH